MTRKTLILIAAFGSLALLAGAFLFQFAGFAPCQMCLWQRWPHAAAVVIGVLALSYMRPPSWLALLGALAAATSGAIGLWHSGVERHWWPGPSTCTGGGDALSGDLLSTAGPSVVMCDEVALYILGFSMANLNVLASVALAAIWVAAARR